MRFSVGCKCCQNTTVTGQIRGCSGPSGSNLGAGNTVTVQTAGGTVLGTGTTDSSGVYTIKITLGASASLDILVAPVSTRVLPAQITTNIIAGATNSGCNLTPPPAGGYACSTQCPLPLAKTLLVAVSSVCDGYGWTNDTLVWTATPPAWLGGTGAPVWIGNDKTLNPGPIGNGTYTYVLTAPTTLTAYYNHSGSAAYGLVGTGATGYEFNKTCPDPSYSASSTCGAGVNIVSTLHE